MTKGSKRKPLTLKRSWGFSTDEKTGVEFEDDYLCGTYQVRWNGSLVAVVTDKWMGEMILEEIAKGRK